MVPTRMLKGPLLVHLFLPRTVDLGKLLPPPPPGPQISLAGDRDAGDTTRQWNSFVSLQRPLPPPLPISRVFPRSHLQRDLSQPISFIAHIVPHWRSRPGRSYLLSRVDKHGRLRFAVALNQWGAKGEYAEIWIHHDAFYNAVVDSSVGTQYSGGLMTHTGIAIAPLPKLDIEGESTVKLAFEVS
ncbi:unnamed protein product [Protopolystoma xenopodis]|uniref:Uncharacterized protein n=1 Tax=Protopolystoma xenopodis TaxID=117903 RepID=A0A3S5AGX1_9PLAT|nr:unnamed protein product [Protopolystoma xenopodis]